MEPFNPLLPLEQGGTELLLIRHGHAVPDEHEIVHGNYDEQPLSALGKQQAQALAHRLRTQPLAAMYSSPIRRAQQTAEMLAVPYQLAVQVEPDLREVDLVGVRLPSGEEMAPKEHVAALQHYLQQIEALALQIGEWSQIPGVESSASVRQRMSEVLHRLVARHIGQRIAVVSHNGAINAAIASLLDIQRDFFFPAVNTSLNVIRLQGEHHLVLVLNDFAHLAALPSVNSPAAQAKRKKRWWGLR